ENESISRTRFTLRGTNSSIQTAYVAGWLSLRLTHKAASPSTKTSSSRAAIIGFTRSASKEAILRAIPFVFREWALALADAVRVRRVSWDQSGDGMVVCCWTRIAGTEAHSSPSRFATDRSRARAFHRDHHRRGSPGSGHRATIRSKNCCCCDPICFWIVSPLSLTSSELGRHARRFWRFNSLVFCDGICPWRRFNADPVISSISPTDACTTRGANGFTHAPDLQPRIR